MQEAAEVEQAGLVEPEPPPSSAFRCGRAAESRRAGDKRTSAGASQPSSGSERRVLGSIGVVASLKAGLRP